MPTEASCRYCISACNCPPVTVVPSAPDDPTLKYGYAFENLTDDEDLTKYAAKKELTE